MKGASLILRTAFLLCLPVFLGCDSLPEAGEFPCSSGHRVNPSLYGHYAPAKIDILPLTEFVETDDARAASKIELFISLLDDFGSAVKAPGVFRFELYEYVRRSAKPKGRRIAVWPDFDLTELTDNNRYWQDFLRSYRFELDFEPQGSQKYILQATCLSPDGRRLSADFVLEFSE